MTLWLRRGGFNELGATPNYPPRILLSAKVALPPTDHVSLGELDAVGKTQTAKNKVQGNASTALRRSVTALFFPTAGGLSVQGVLPSLKRRLSQPPTAVHPPRSSLGRTWTCIALPAMVLAVFSVIAPTLNSTRRRRKWLPLVEIRDKVGLARRTQS